MILSTLFWGAAAGVVHFFLIGLLYGNPIVDRMYTSAMGAGTVLKPWPSKVKYLVTQFIGTQVEVYIVTAAFLWLRPLLGLPGMSGALVLGGVLAGIRVYPRFWNMWIQTKYPNRLLAIELVNGSLGTLAIVLFLEATALA